MTEVQDLEVVALSELVYAVIHNKEDTWRKLTIPDCAGPDIDYAYGWFMEDEDALWMEVVKLNPDDFWRAYFYFNDSEGPEEACEHEFNTREHADIHWESNNGDGHYDCSHYDHVVNGVVVETIEHDCQRYD